MARVTKRQLVTGLILLGVVLITGLFLATRHHRNEVAPDQAETTPQYINVSGLDAHGDVLDADMISALQDRLYQVVIQNGGHSNSVYTGSVRADSFSVTYQTYEGQTPSIQVPIYAFIVDIPNAKQSYKITYAGGTNYPYAILHVVCPSASELIYGDFRCVDSEQ